MRQLLLALFTMLAVHAAWAAEPSAPSPLPALQGEVLEVLDAGAFTYARLKTVDGEVWAGVRRVPLSKGARITIDDPVEMRDFESKALQRRFEVMYFGRLAAPPGAPAARAADGISVPHGGLAGMVDPTRPHGQPVPAPDAAPVQVAKADGADARTIAEVYAERLALKDRSVTIRAQVMKVTPGVMGRNWIHLRDGSGSSTDGSDDLVATSQQEPKLGDIVVARGTVRTDVNLGSGYAYRVLVEDTTFRK